jgi:hypothetical protein
MATEEVAMAYPPGAVERAMKAHEVIMRALNGQLTWVQAAEILGRSPRSIRRLRWLLQHRGYDGLFDRRRRTPSPKRAPVAEVQRLLALYRERYQGFNVRQPHLAGSSRERAARRRHHDGGRGQPLPAGAVHPRLQRRVRSPPADPASAFVPLDRVDLDQILCVEEERGVDRDNVVGLGGVALQVAKQPGRRSCAGLRVLVRRHLDGQYSIWYGARCLGRYDRQGRARHAA